MSANERSGSTLTREQILAALEALSDQLGKQGLTGEICRFGGTVMVLAFTARLTTKDTLFQPAQIIRQIARRNAEEQGLPAGWLNDGVKVDQVGQYYPRHRIPVKTQYLVEGLFEEGAL